MKIATYEEQLVNLEVESKHIVHHYGKELNLLQVVGTLEQLKNSDNRPSLVIDKPKEVTEQLRHNLGMLFNDKQFISEVEKIGILTMLQLDITQGAFAPQHGLERVSDNG